MRLWRKGSGRTLLGVAAVAAQSVLDATKAQAARSHIPKGNLTLVDRQDAHAHNDPAGAHPHNVFFDRLVPFLDGIGTHS